MIGWPMDLNRLLEQAVQAGASDIHLKVGRPPLARKDGVVEELPGWESLTDQNLLVALERVCADSPSKLQSFHESGDLDLAYTAAGLPRFRVNAFRQRGAISFAFRVIPKDVPSFEQLSMPAVVPRLANEHRGRVAAVEVMVMNARISDLIREERTEEIGDAVAEGGFFEMQTFEQALIDLVLAGLVEREIAANAATNVHDFQVALDHALKRQTVEVVQEQAALEAAAAEDEAPALRVVRPAGA